MRHKTIVCTPELFDGEFEKFKEKVEVDSLYISKMEIKHDGIHHYILYKLSWND